MIRLLLINPTNIHKGFGKNRISLLFPLHLPYVAAVTPNHYQIKIIDENIKPFTYEAADIVGITAYTSSVYRAYQIAQIYRDKKIPTIIGGIHASMLPEEAMKFCDSVVIGEAENIWPKVLEDFETGKLKKQYQGSIVNMETVPLPRRDLIENHSYLWGGIQTSRGCPMGCSFCSVSVFNGRQFRRRPLESVIAELEQIPQKFVFITDDNIIGYGARDLEWTILFFRSLIENKIKKNYYVQTSIHFGENQELIHLASKAGVRVVFIGMESMIPNSLKSYNKTKNMQYLQYGRYKEIITTIRKAGIAVMGGFIFGNDAEDISVFHSTLEFIKDSKIDVFEASKLTPLPGTQLWKKIKEEGRIINQDFPKAWEDYRLTKMVFKPAKMSIEDVYEGFTYLRKKYYGFWETFKRTLATLFSTKSLMSTFIAYGLNYSFKRGFKESEHYQLYNKPGLEEKFKLATNHIKSFETKTGTAN